MAVIYLKKFFNTNRKKFYIFKSISFVRDIVRDKKIVIALNLKKISQI